MSKKDIHEGSWLSSVINKGKWYLIASIFTKILNFFLLPIYTEYLSPKEYGILESLNSVALLLPLLVSLSLDAAFARFYHDYKKDEEALRKLFSSIYWFVTGFGIIVTFFAIITARYWVQDLLGIPIYPYVLLSFMPPLFLQLGMLGIIYLRQSLLSKETSLIIMIGVLLNIIVVLPLLIYWDQGLKSLLIGRASIAIFYFLFTTIYFFRKGLLHFSIDKKILKKTILYAAPLIPSAGSNWIANLSDRLVIANYVDLEAVGLYSLAFQIALLLYVIGDAITQVIGPVTMSGLINDKERTKKKIADFSLLLWMLMLLLCLGLFLFSREIVTIFAADAYEEAYKIIPIVSFPFVIGVQYRFFASIISFYKKTWILSSAAIGSAILNLGLNFALVPTFGYFGAVWATLITRLGYGFYIIFWGQKLEPIKLYVYKMMQLLFLFLIIVAIIYAFLFDKDLSISLFFIKALLLFISVFMSIQICQYWTDIEKLGKQYLFRK